MTFTYLENESANEVEMTIQLGIVSYVPFLRENQNAEATSRGARMIADAVALTMRRSREAKRTALSGERRSHSSAKRTN